MLLTLLLADWLNEVYYIHVRMYFKMEICVHQCNEWSRFSIS